MKSNPDSSLRLACFSAGVTAAIPYQDEVARQEEAIRPELRSLTTNHLDAFGRRIGELVERNAELMDEVDDLSTDLSESLQELEDMLLSKHYGASAEAILALALINNGLFVRDLYQALQTTNHDMTLSENEDYKAKIKVVIKVSPGNVSDSAMSAKYGIEIKAETPPAASEGYVFMDAKGRIILPKEAVKQLPLMAVRPASSHSSSQDDEDERQAA